MTSMTRRQAMLCSVAAAATAPLARPSVLEALKPVLRQSTLVPPSVLWPGVVRFFQADGKLHWDEIKPEDYLCQPVDYS